MDNSKLNFEQIVTDNEKKVYNIAFGFLKNSADALDASQETFLRVFKNLQGFKHESSVSTWIYRITANVCIDMIRKRRDNVISFNDDENEAISAFEPVSEFGNPEQDTLQSELRKSIRLAIDKLSPDHKEAIILRDVNGFSYSEIALILEIEEGTVKSRIARARIKLREILLKDGNFTEEYPSKKV